MCRKCGPTYSKEDKPVELPSIGTAFTWTKLQVAPKGFPSPLVHSVIDVGGVKMIGTVQGAPEIQSGEKLVILEDTSRRFPFALSRPFKQAKPTQSSANTHVLLRRTPCFAPHGDYGIMGMERHLRVRK